VSALLYDDGSLLYDDGSLLMALCSRVVFFSHCVSSFFCVSTLLYDDVSTPQRKKKKRARETKRETERERDCVCDHSLV